MSNNPKDLDSNEIGKREARYYARRFSDHYFKTGDKKKFCRKIYNEDMVSSHLSGQVVMREIITRRNKNKPYQSVDEILADLDLIATESFNYYALKLSDGRLKPVSIDEITNLTT